MQTNVSTGEDLVMVLQDDLSGNVTTAAVNIHITVDIIVTNAQRELKLVLNISNTRVGPENITEVSVQS